MSAATNIKSIRLSTHPEGNISVAHLEHPYGEFSDPVVSIGVSLQPDPTPQWQVHIPYRDLDDVIKLLEEARRDKEARGNTYHHTDELSSDTGGGA